MMESFVLYIIGCVVMFLAGAAVSRGFGRHKHHDTVQQQESPEDAYARDFAALMGYSGEVNETEGQNET